MDVTDLSELESGTFGGVVDKGTLDAILCGEGSSVQSEKMLGEIARLVKPGGCFLCITYGQPTNRLHYLEKKKYNWDIEYKSVVKPTSTKNPEDLEEEDLHYIYVMKKRMT
eukprot:TRINITY_DN198_c0_g2_i4.p1 TRINITY_DN198_c0_g2~~TRINITY_DN198_c0_g2_i4.p1  ORF type:complete len:111 (-),score=21.48 TRINITY_DN198_c0_g2_i4:25-357(-)